MWGVKGSGIEIELIVVIWWVGGRNEVDSGVFVRWLPWKKGRWWEIFLKWRLFCCRLKRLLFVEFWFCWIVFDDFFRENDRAMSVFWWFFDSSLINVRVKVLLFWFVLNSLFWCGPRFLRLDVRVLVCDSEGRWKWNECSCLSLNRRIVGKFFASFLICGKMCSFLLFSCFWWSDHFCLKNGCFLWDFGRRVFCSGSVRGLRAILVNLMLWMEDVSWNNDLFLCVFFGFDGFSGWMLFVC